MNKLNIDPIKIMMDKVASKTSIIVEIGLNQDKELHIKIDPKHILDSLPTYLKELYKMDAAYRGYEADSKPIDKVVIHFEDCTYKASAVFEEIKTTKFKGYKKDKVW